MEDITDYLINREDSIEYKNGKDTNVGSIEEDIKVLKKLLETLEELFQLTKVNNTKERNALKNLLTDYEKQKEESKKYEQMYLDEVDKHVDVVLLYNGLLNKIKDKIEENSNIIKEIEEKIKEEENSEDVCREYIRDLNIRDLNRQKGLAKRDILTLQELLPQEETNE